MKTLIAFFALSLALFAAPLAEARTLRYPEAGGPGITLEIPDAWTARPSGRNLLIADETHRVGFAIFIGEAAPDFDAIAAGVRPEGMAPLVRGEDTQVDGRTGAVYHSTMSRGGVTSAVTVTMFELSGGYLASVTMFEVEGASPEAIAAVRASFLSVRVVQ